LNTNNYPHPNYIDFPFYTHEYTIRLFKPIIRSSISSRSIETLYMQSIFIILRFHSFSLYFDCYSLCLIYFNWIFLCSIFSRSLYIIFVLFLLNIVLSVLLRFTYFDYTFGIFKVFLYKTNLSVWYITACI
jgi:hypothetical protein